jgi:histidine triad (HIT) family protein
MENCLFCKIVARQIPSNIVYEDENVLAFSDIDPQAPQHMLFIPKRHIASMTDLTLEDGTILAQIYVAAKIVAQDHHLEGGYRFLTNVGPDAGQSVFHLHFHLLGGRPLKWPPG